MGTKVTIELSDADMLKIARPYIERNEELKEQNEKLLNDAKACADEALRYENESLKQRLSLSYGQFSSEKELKAFNAFSKKHEKCRAKFRADNGRAPYIIPYGTGLGTCVTAVCPVCGEKKEITDISVW